MNISLYMDENVPRKITEGLRRRGVDVLTAQDDNQIGTPDLVLLERASELGRVIFTQDRDFLAIANQRQQEGKNFTGVIYAHQQNVTVGECVRELEIIAKAANSEDLANLVQYLPL